MPTQTIDDFFDKYTPVTNKIEDRGWGEDGKSQMFETFGPELEFVQKQADETVWTLLDTDEGQAICAGFHFVNRIGYVITEQRWKDSTECYEDNFNDDLFENEEEEDEDDE